MSKTESPRNKSKNKKRNAIDVRRIYSGNMGIAYSPKCVVSVALPEYQDHRKLLGLGSAHTTSE